MLADLIRDIELGIMPPADATLQVMPAPSPRIAAVVAFTAHTVVAADVDDAWVRERVPDGDLAAPLNPPFLSALEERLDRRVNCIDMAIIASPLTGPPPVTLTPVTESDHPRVERALRYRDDVQVWSATSGVLILGRGLAGRWEAAIEVDEDARGQGLGRALAMAARHLVPSDRKVWAQTSPGNAASVRAFMSAGFTPVGSEALLVPSAR